VTNEPKKEVIISTPTLHPAPGYQLELAGIMDFTSCGCGQFERSVLGGRWSYLLVAVEDRHSCSFISFIMSLANTTLFIYSP